ncbi:helix-turn-helix domain-containing protein [Amycolatopsis sp. CA-126428]|uniref:helix-turn-helix domain-containing protein n=1 Tax=Amycolatopsis sp. CA-126428 TaxID=2073158 RepID=UPI000CD25699|nr:helix-turn-helix transcriptional regulator [Amycolatopsis sp. CA-126428]
MATLVATPRSRALGFGIRAARKARNLGVRELARLAGVVAQDLSHWESGTRVPKIEQVALLLGALRVEPAERKRLLELARNAREPNWLEHSIPGISPRLSAFIEYERTASAIFAWEPLLIPGLLQTPEYVRTILAAAGRSRAEEELRIKVRLMRQEVLTGRDPSPYTALLAETALRQRRGGAEIMAPQLRHLAELAQRRNVSLRVLPDNEDFHPGLNGSFVIFDYADLPPIVFLEQYRGSAYLYDEQQVADYRAAQRAMAALALSEQESCALIREVIADLEA